MNLSKAISSKESPTSKPNMSNLQLVTYPKELKMARLDCQSNCIRRETLWFFSLGLTVDLQEKKTWPSKLLGNSKSSELKNSFWFPHYLTRSDLTLKLVQCMFFIYCRENNVYFKSKGKVGDINLVENKEQRLLSISHLIDDEDLESDLMKNGGLANAFYQ